MKNKLILAVAVLIAGLAFLMNWSYLRKEKAALYEGAKKVTIIAASRDLPSMTVLTIEDLGTLDVFQSSVGKNAFYEDDLQALLGRKLLYPVKRNDPLLWSQVDMPRRIKSGLSPVIEKGKRAISLSIAGAQAVSGLVQPNDNVDIIGTFSFPSRTNPRQVESVTMTLLQNVSVIATGSLIAGQENRAQSRQGGYSTVTFSVTPRQVEVLVFAQQTRGQLYLSLRNPEDRSSESELPSVNFDYIEDVLQEMNEKHQKEIMLNEATTF